MTKEGWKKDKKRNEIGLIKGEIRIENRWVKDGVKFAGFTKTGENMGKEKQE